jgi:hypothetical protein
LDLRHRVPAEALRPHLERELRISAHTAALREEELEKFGDAVKCFAFRCDDLHPDVISRILTGRKQTVPFETADRIISKGLGDPGIWSWDDELAKYVDPPPVPEWEGPRACPKGHKYALAGGPLVQRDGHLRCRQCSRDSATRRRQDPTYAEKLNASRRAKRARQRAAVAA